MLYCHVSAVASHRQTKHWLQREPFAFFAATVGMVRQGVFSWLRSATSPLDGTNSYTLEF